MGTNFESNWEKKTHSEKQHPVLRKGYYLCRQNSLPAHKKTWNFFGPNLGDHFEISTFFPIYDLEVNLLASDPDGLAPPAYEKISGQNVASSP